MTQRGRTMLIGALVGTAIAVAGLLVARALTPAMHAASVLLLVPERPELFDDEREAMRSMQRSVRDALARRIDDPELLPKIVREQNVPNAAAAEFSRSLSAIAVQSRPSFVALSARSHDAQALAALLDATADTLLQADAGRALLAQDDQIAALEQLDAQLVAQDETAARELADVVLPTWAKAGATALGLLDARRFAASLGPTLGRLSTSFEQMEMARVDSEIQALGKDIGGKPSVTAEHFAAARLRASTASRRAHLARARQQILERDPTASGLNVVQYAQPIAIPPPRRRLLWIALVGASLGALTGFLRFMGRPEEAGQRDGPTLETHLHVRVLGNMAAALCDYAERKSRPLAQTHPDHPAVEAVRSLDTALHIVRHSSSLTGPVIMVNADAAHNAGHVLANLAMLAALREERVLLIDTQGEESVLSDLFTTGTRTMLSTAVDADDLEKALPKRKRGGRIRFVVAEDPESDDPPVPGAFASHFDRIYIRAHSIERAAKLAASYDGATGVLVARHSLSIRDWQDARDEWRDLSDSLIGLVQCGHIIDESAYAAPKTSS